MNIDEALATSLQAEEGWACDDDSVAAIFLAIMDDTPMESFAVNEGDTTMEICDSKPAAVAPESTFNDEHLAIQEAKLEMEAAMQSSMTGKAWAFVSKLLEEHRNNLPAAAGCCVLAVDDLMYTVERFFETRDIFQMEGKNTRVDLGYHYTRSDNLDCIQMNGLMTRSDRQANGVDNNFNGAAWGDGVYTGNNFHSFKKFGDIGLIVARLRGDQNDAISGGRGFTGDTAVAYKDRTNEMVILQQSSQCIPLVYFQRSSIDEHGDDIIECQRRLQQMCDEIFLGGMTTVVDLSPSVVSAPKAPSQFPRIEPYSVSPAKVVPMTLDVPSASPTIWSKKGMLFPSGQDIFLLKRKEIFSSTSQIVQRCGNPAFRGLFETMRVVTYPTHTFSKNGEDIIVVVYAFHPTDCGRTCTHRIAYVPDNIDGWALLRRLKYAFWVGIMGTGTWRFIPHVTNPYAKLPSDYFRIANHALDRAGIPQPENCEFMPRTTTAAASPVTQTAVT